MPTYEAMRAGYGNLWKSMRVTRVTECNAAARRIIAGASRYKEVEAKTGVPWYWIGITHMRESGNNFAGVLHNGEHIIGKGTKTRLVPAGRGPFTTWEAAAIDAIKLKGLDLIKAWPIERVLFECERFNGFGYTSKGVNSPYVWAGSSHQQAGKYIADGVWSSTAMDTQLGCAPVLARLCEMDPEVKARVTGKPVPAKGDAVKDSTIGAGGVGVGTTVAVGVQQGWSMTTWIIVGVVAVALIVGAYFAVQHFRKPATKPPPIEYVPPLDDDTVKHERGGHAGETE